MDSIKIIKKHGQPGGLPVVTVYVDENAPGESGNIELYLHTISSSSVFLVSVVTTDDTPFTADAFAEFLQDNGFTSQSSALPVNSFRGFSNSSGSIYSQRTTKLWGASSGTYKLRSEALTQPISISEGSLTVGSSAVTEAGLPTIDDAVIKLS